MIRYYNLFALLAKRGMKKTDLLSVISAPTLAKLSKGANVQTDCIDKICLFLGCQPSDIMEVISNEEILTDDYLSITKNIVRYDPDFIPTDVIDFDEYSLKVSEVVPIDLEGHPIDLSEFKDVDVNETK